MMINRPGNRLIDRLIDRLRAGLRARSGETLVETLAAMLVVVMGLMILPGAIVASARLDNAVSQQKLVIEEGSASTDMGSVTLQLEAVTASGTLSPKHKNMKVYRYGDEDDGFYRMER